MGMLVIHHQVKDFATWKLAYDRHADKRKAAGLRHDHVLQSVDDANSVTIIMDFMDPARAKAFAASPDLKKVMKAAGVLGAPTIHILKKMT